MSSEFLTEREDNLENKDDCTENEEQGTEQIDPKEESRLREFQKLLLSQSSSDESIHKVEDDIQDLASHENSVVATSAVVGTTQNSTNSFRHRLRVSSQVLTESEKKNLKKKRVSRVQDDFMEIDSLETQSYEFENMNAAETLALFESEEDEEKRVKKDNGSIKSDESSCHKLKKAVITILLTNKWHHKNKATTGKQVEKIRLQPTFRMEPKDDFNSLRYRVTQKLKQTFESLVEKHGKYDVEYTPRFLRIITEMLKNDAKSFKLDRYKIVVHVTILQKIFAQSILFISKELFNIDDDHKIALRVDTKSVNAVCLVFFVYHE